ncbi:MAG: hypothetical protein FP825_10195 [Hyphomonas sp.]|uniref:hypothetical protein n=1 Tax=Hyphomonas sp. TaxID=87 RepID=UPI0017AEEAF2|nr:hypothetical protein [Hyphomonas sp.]MBA3068840.1 hypothetical protein [Hyphomonas sp.]MBU3920821.1 hypothetical protein [Alphaproteobacteria bacterium]MBU4062949.1 hypothetical protein [Alphaproteobacteria bacterium]MBU4165481.1 hypothetical protein [Alphaproteobacteria bacterium]
MMNWLDFMTRTDGPRVTYLFRAFLVTVGGTALMATLAVMLFPTEAQGEPAPPPPFIGFVILWPAISTLAIWGVLVGAKRLTPTYWHAAGLCTLVIAGLFGVPAGMQGAMIFAWPYFIYALTFLAWQLKSDFDACLMTFLLQVAVNLVPALFLFPPAE